MTEIEQLNEHIAECKKHIDKFNKLQELHKNPLFKELITEGFCKDCIAEYMTVSVNGKVPEAARENARGIATAGAYLNNWFIVVAQQAAMANEDIRAAEDEIAKLNNDEVEQ